VVQYISAMDICTVPDPANEYNNRTTVIKLMEYMAREKPTVAFDLPEHRVTAAGAALYARPNDQRDFAAQLVRLMDDADLRRTMGACGRQRIVSELAWEHQAQHLLDAYQAMLGGPLAGKPSNRETERTTVRPQVPTSREPVSSC